MKTFLYSPFRKYGSAMMAATSLAAFAFAPQSRAEDDKDHHKGGSKGGSEHHASKEEHKGGTEHRNTKEQHRGEGKKEEHHTDKVAHKEGEHGTHKEGGKGLHQEDQKITHKEGEHHKGEVVHNKGEHEHGSHDKGMVDKGGKGSHGNHGGGNVASGGGGGGGSFHHHKGWGWHQGNGYHGKGWYYGPASIGFYEETPDVVYYASRSDVPAEDLDDNSSNQSTEAAVQQALLDKGYYHGAVDGELGPMSHRSIARYQRDNGMRPTGLITDDLLSSLGIH